MRYCKVCVQNDQRPNIYFKNGVCGACLWEQEKRKVDWNERSHKLRKIAEEAKAKNADYDCVVGVSGGKDSTLQALYARDVLGLRTLLVNYEPDGITEIGKKNIENLKQLGFDTISVRPNPQVLKKLIKKDFYEYLNPIKVTEFPLFAVSYIIADKFDIPLVIQGENPALTLGLKNGYGTDDDALNTNKGDTLRTGWERYIGDGVSEKDLFFYRYDEEGIRKKGIRAIWLQYYLKDWSPYKNAQFSIKHGLTARPKDTDPADIGTHCLYATLDSDLSPLNQYLKYLKFGFGATTDHACYDIREGLITREQGLELIKKYDDKVSIKYIKGFCDYIGITLDEFWRQVESFRNKTR